MKKQNNIFELTKTFIYLAFTCILLNACTDEQVYSSTDVVEGIPVDVQFKLSIPGMDKIATRSLTDDQESQVNDLYILVFDMKGKIVTGKFYDTDEIVSSLENYSSGSLSLATTSGERRIYAVANVKETELSGLLPKLEAVKTINDLFNVTATLTSETNVERIVAGLTMSGVFEAKSASAEQKEQGYCIINENGGLLNGKLYLTRLDSHITFKIATGPEVLTFTPTSWQVKYVPMKSTVIAQNKNILSLEDAGNGDYTQSNVSNRFATSNEGATTFRTFDFYMLESIKKAISTEDGSIAADVSQMSIEEKKAEYAKRELEYKTDFEYYEDGSIKSCTNTGIYKYSEKFATFVEIKANLEIKNGENIRVAYATYRVHLGGGINDPANFTSKRNTKYTYLMQINNVDDIVVEVEDDNERRPGVEGDVIDAETQVRSLDAHYNCFIIGLSYNNVATPEGQPNLKFMVKTPFGEVTEKSTPDDMNAPAKQDYHWIRFLSHGTANSSETMQIYKKEQTVELFNLAEDVITRYNDDKSPDKNGNKLYYYTVYIDEYYYDEAPKGQAWGNDKSTYWRHFANADNRYAMLVYAPKYSVDGNSSHAAARYLITQRSIQTYYSTKAETALGMEHINETGAAKWGNPGIITDSKNGLWNTWLYLGQHTQWDSHTTRTAPDSDMNTFKTSPEAIALARCLSRNRDENGDGIITTDEVKWYVPTSDQLLGMYLGAESLPSPLFDAANIDWTKVTLADRGLYHYVTSDNRRVWSDEGGSVGPIDAPWGTGAARNFRCVRNLGLDIPKGGDITKTDVAREAFDYNASAQVNVYDPTVGGYRITTAERVFDLNMLTDLNKRGRINSGEIGLHDNFSNGNKPFKAFQMAKTVLPTRTGEKDREVYTSYTDLTLVPMTTWNILVRSYSYMQNSDKYYLITDNDRSYCKNYSEEANDKGLWRAPNQREVMLMAMHNFDDIRDVYTRTWWRYDNERHFGVTGNNLYLDNVAERYIGAKLRCVRDVEIEK